MLCQFLHSDRAPFFGILMMMPWLQSSGIFFRESWKDWLPLHGLAFRLLHRLPYGLPPLTTLNKQPNFCLWGERHKKPLHLQDYNYAKKLPFSFHRLPWTSLFSFLPRFFIGNRPKPCFNQWAALSVCHGHYHLQKISPIETEFWLAANEI